MDIWILDTYTKVFKDTIRPGDYEAKIQLDSAKNEYESAQIVLKGNEDFEIYSVNFTDLTTETGLIGNRHIRYNFQEGMRFNDGVTYPDPLSNERTVKVKKDEAQSIWITIYVPIDSRSGHYKGTAQIMTSVGEFDVDIELLVYSVTIPNVREANFNLEYWNFFVGSWYHGYDAFNVIERQYGYKKYSPKWWNLLNKAILNMKENRINTILVRTQDLLLDAGSTMDEKGIYHFKWTLFDQYVESFMEAQVVKNLVGFQLMEQCNLNFIHTINRNEEGIITITNEAIGSVAAENFLNQYLVALRIHLEEKGWLNKWLQHIADEPNFNSEHYVYVSEKVKQFLPTVKRSEPLDTMAFNQTLTGQIDLWIPRIEHFDEHYNFFKERQSLGEEVWVYSCCMPVDPCYLNKFIDRPYWHCRLLSWGCFKQGVSGFLHWGYNYWDDRDENFGYTPNAYFKGDGFIVFPDASNDAIKNSARMIATRDGIEDYELFKMLEKKDSLKAKELVSSVITNFSYFTGNLKKIKEVRKELLRLCSND